MTVVGRVSVASDVPDIESLFSDGLEHNFASLLETSLLCLTAVDTSQGQDVVVGFLCFDDAPCLRLNDEGTHAAQDWLAAHPACKTLASSTAFIRASAFNAEHEVEAVSALLREALALSFIIQRFLLATTKDITFTEPGMASLFTRVAMSKDVGTILYECKRSHALPPLSIRPARVEDHDDMLPVLEVAGKKFPALAKLPESSRPDEPFALTRVVSGQDARNQVLVAAVGRRLVGFMVVTSEVDTSSLNDHFDLHPYDNFLPPEVYDQQYAAAKQAAFDQKLNTLRARTPRTPRKPSNSNVLSPRDGVAEGAEGEEGAEQVAEGPTAEELAEEEAKEAALQAEAQPTEDEIRHQMSLLFGGMSSDAEPNIFAITMLCIDPAYEAHGMEFLREAFAVFPDKQYCVLTLPHESLEPPLISMMNRVAPLPGALFPEVLYHFNRAGLIEDFEVRPAGGDDVGGVTQLVAGMPNAGDIVAMFMEARDKGSAMVAVCQGEVVGLCTVNAQVDTTLLQANFSLSQLVDLQHHTPEKHGEIEMYVMNPIFSHRHRVFLSGVQRIMRKSCLYYALPPGQQPPDMLDVLLQVPARHRGLPSEMQAEFALYLFTRRAAFSRRTALNAKIVVVGASEAGLAALERLLLDTEYCFNYLTLLAPGGISVGGVACQYTASVIAKLGLEARVVLLDADMVGLDRASKLIELSDGNQLAYDMLLITAGLQDQTRDIMSMDDPAVSSRFMTSLELAADFSLGDAKMMSNIAVYGNTLQAYHALSVLEHKGAAQAAKFIAPEGQVEPLVHTLRAVGAKLGLAVPEPKPMQLQEMHSIHGEIRAVAKFQPGAAGAQDVEPVEEVVDLLVTCSPPEPSNSLFQCLNDSSIIFDGRLVVDAAFRTNDPSIYASGSIAKLSRRFGRNVQYQHYNSMEVGQKLAESVISFFKGEQQPEVVPSLTSARVVGCTVPGEMTFMFTGCAAALANPALDGALGGRSLSTTSERGFFQINLDKQQCIYSIIYLGKSPLQVSKLSSLVGLHANYLNQLVERYDRGEINDFLFFLTEPWAELLYHDQFAGLRAGLVDMAMHAAANQGGEEGATPAEVMAEVQDATMEFIRSKISELPLYHVPNMAAR